MNQYDVIVAGGGPAGTAAAIASARNGARTLLIEQNGYLGGMATGASIPAFCTYTDGIQTIIRGIGLEILENLKGITWRSPFYDRKPGRIEGMDWLPIDSEALKLVLDQMVTDSGCQVLFHTSLVDCEVSKTEGETRIDKLVIHNKSGLQNVSADTYIDGTGDADLADLAGCRTEYGDEHGQVQAGTLCFKVANFDTKRFMEYAEKAGETGNLSKAVECAMAANDFPEGEVKVAGIALPSPGMASFNFGHIFGGINPVNGADMTRAEMQSRKKLPELMRFIRTYVPGAEDAVLAFSGPNVGVRESRRICGRYRMTMEDYEKRADYQDSIAYYSYPVDMHGAKAGDSKELELNYQQTRYRSGESYGIPYRCLVPESTKNLLAAGRSISCDRAMQASLRVMPACFAMGQAAGTAAAMAAQEGIGVAEVDTVRLRRTLKQQGAYLKEEK